MTTETKQITCDRYEVAVASTESYGELDLEQMTFYVHRSTPENPFPMPEQDDIEEAAYEKKEDELDEYWGGGSHPKQIVTQVVGHERVTLDANSPWTKHLLFGLENRKLNDWIEN